MDARHYTAMATLRDGSAVLVRAQRPDDRAGLEQALGRMDDESIQMRFFAPKRYFSDTELSFFLDIDFVQQVALVAELDGVIAGGCRYIATQPGRAEVAFAVADDCQGRGLGRVLLEHLAGIARAQGLQQLFAEVLPDNTPMLAVFRKSGLQTVTRHEAGVVHVTLDLT
ncbi:GNAT family N-acetyltransferase [Ramlibacter sp. G-1-2-2]|uniref:GNAT family N-acetyltransferase n=1 Tax=Ramlibacter agri TaxID=2728837 RepID=A0A848H5J1_9BURK|nr:GNAT family N-acetyltransferase [Ramlibacter agri]NML46256.1 GNAT family N-acetyltransferase [Ramlibacter agri]